MYVWGYYCVASKSTFNEKCFKGNDEVPDRQVTLQGKVLAYYVPLELQPIKIQSKREYCFNENKLTRPRFANENFITTKKLIPLTLMDTSTP